MRVWLITGAAGGLGRAFASAALERGDAVALAAREVGRLADLAASPNALAVELDVDDRAAVFAAVARVHEHFGRIDVLVNNAGYGLHGAVEETAESEARDIVETNLFGALWVTQAVAPVMRAQGSGHMIAVSSAAGITGFPLVGLYSATKFGLEGLYECLALELEPFGVHVTILEPSDFRTSFRSSCRRRAEPIAAYEERFAENLEQMAPSTSGTEEGDPALRRGGADGAGRAPQPAAAPRARQPRLRPRHGAPPPRARGVARAGADRPLRGSAAPAATPARGRARGRRPRPRRGCESA